MAFNREEKNGCALLKIEGALTVNEVSTLRDELLECLDTYDGLTVDLGGVSECDAAGIQLLCASRVTGCSAGKPFIVTLASAALIDAFDRVGLTVEEIFGATEKQRANEV